MTKTEAIKESIAHWNCMIRWARKRKERLHPTRSFMEQALGESWSGEYCALCKKYQGHATCISCPLRQAGYDCEEWDGPWRKVARAQTWCEWVIAAVNMRTILKSLLPKPERRTR